MRLGVLDVGSNTVHLLVVEARPGAAPDPVRRHKTDLHLAELIGSDQALGTVGRGLLVRAVQTGCDVAREEQVDELVAFATSAIRDAADGDRALREVADETGVDLQVLPGVHEARLTFLAVRRWFGWSAGRLASLDIGGGSLEIACGADETPEFAVSLPLGAGRLTRDLVGPVPTRKTLERLQVHIRGALAPAAREVLARGLPDRGVGSSKTFRSLSRLEHSTYGPRSGRTAQTVSLQGVERIVERLARMTPAQRTSLPGISRARSHQLLAGAMVASEAMHALHLDHVAICPWALREGIVLRRLEWLSQKSI